MYNILLVDNSGWFLQIVVLVRPWFVVFPMQSGRFCRFPWNRAIPDVLPLWYVRNGILDMAAWRRIWIRLHIQPRSVPVRQYERRKPDPGRSCLRYKESPDIRCWLFDKKSHLFPIRQPCSSNRYHRLVEQEQHAFLCDALTPLPANHRMKCPVVAGIRIHGWWNIPPGHVSVTFLSPSSVACIGENRSRPLPQLRRRRHEWLSEGRLLRDTFPLFPVPPFL